jgi:uncharacterized protein (DUF488 family)
MPRFDLFTIGHSSVAAARFVTLLKEARVQAVADVRSVPFSRRYPWFSQRNLAPLLAQSAIGYAAMGDVLGGRPRDDRLYHDGVADYDAMAARPDFRAAIERLAAESRHEAICLMCAEREPLDCHRCLLVARSLAERGVAIGHILHDGVIEPHEAVEQRLIGLYDDGTRDLFAAGQRERLAAAYRRRARAIAFRQQRPDRAAENE